MWGLAQQAAGFWDASIRRAGIGDPDGGDSLGDALFDQILANPSGIVFSRDDYDETIKRLLTPDGKVNLVIPQLLEEFDALADELSPLAANDEYPFVLAAGERRSSTANTIYRDPSWRKQDQQGALRLSPGDADAARAHRRRPRPDHHQARRRRRRGRGDRHDARRARLAAQRVRARRLARRCRRLGRHRTERAHLHRRPRLVRRHAVPQARPSRSSVDAGAHVPLPVAGD